MALKFIPVNTRPILPPKDNIYPILDASLPKLREGDVVFITSKILAIHQGRSVKIRPGIKKVALIKKEADRYENSHLKSWKDLYLTIKGHTLIANAGIDESNANGYYILWPKNSTAEAKKIWTYLRRKHRIKDLAVVITDSHIIPMRQGTQGVSIGFYGMEPLYDYRGKPDIFGRLLRHTTKNIVDGVSSMAVLLMGEGNERTPILVLRGAKFIVFTEKNRYRQSVVEPKNDLYQPLWRNFK